MLIRISPGSDRAIYIQIASALEEQISSGILKAGDRLPSARSLSSSLEVNMHTVLKAYSHLQERSLVDMRRGRGGVIVADAPDMEQAARQLVSLARRKGLTMTEVAEFVERAWK